MSGTFTSLVIVESVLTAAAILMVIYRSMLDMKEEDHIVLDNAEAHLVREQEEIRHKVNVISRYLRIVGIVWLALLVVVFVMWVAQGLGML